MKICVITTAHPPNDVRINKEIKTALKAGASITYIAPQGVFDIDGVDYIPITKHASRIKRFVFGSREAFKKALKVDANIYHFHDPELINIGIKLKKTGKKVIYDIHENYPSVILQKTWIPRFLRKILAKVVDVKERRAVSKFDGIVVVVPQQLQRFQGVREFAVLPNYPESTIFNEVSENKKSDKLRFVYVGSLDEDRAIIEMIKAYEILVGKGYEIELHLAGPIYTEKIRQFIQRAEVTLKGFRYFGQVPYKKALEITANSDIGMLVIHRGKSKEESSPLKMFEYMAFGLPIIASNFDYWKNILENPSCALYVDPESPEDIAKKMELLVKDQVLRKTLGNAGREKSKNYLWESIEECLVELYERVGKK
ncbi:glycosyltransferase family 4 protein [Kosmotoga pacifica]|uniref:Glycosyl transferase family 1 domain-containing protein n=1 Tax=Kosmotoga pacifica TaxID=1330330 RepID=A0A0G2ZAC2_9BACT|nr:glycosyltransferase family 4 protein [Kosmotoga pacifica]AKI96524.1 hypothetical protein IX53_00325 [Kosmotoga pacifica]